MTPAPALSPAELLVLKPEQAAQLLAVSRTTVYALTGSGALPTVTVYPGGPARILRADLDAYLLGRKREGQAALQTHLTLTQPAIRRERQRDQKTR